MYFIVACIISFLNLSDISLLFCIRHALSNWLITSSNLSLSLWPLLISCIQVHAFVNVHRRSYLCVPYSSKLHILPSSSWLLYLRTQLAYFHQPRFNSHSLTHASLIHIKSIHIFQMQAPHITSSIVVKLPAFQICMAQIKHLSLMATWPTD